jgi:hypothetical protein
VGTMESSAAGIPKPKLSALERSRDFATGFEFVTMDLRVIHFLKPWKEVAVVRTIRQGSGGRSVFANIIPVSVSEGLCLKKVIPGRDFLRCGKRISYILSNFDVNGRAAIRVSPQ